MILGYFALTKMKPVCLLYFSPLLLLGLANSCCVESSSDLKRKWELWTHPFLRKRAVEIAQKRLLSILGLENFPTPGRHVIPHKFMLELYRNLSSGTYKGNLSYDMVPSAVVGIVDQGQCVLLSGGFCKCLSLFVFVLRFCQSRISFLVPRSRASDLKLRPVSFSSFPCRTPRQFSDQKQSASILF